MTDAIFAVFMMGGLGLIIGVCLAAASKVFYVYVDPQIIEVEGVLPGANCGGCGLPGCGANAEAIVAGKASPNSCVAAGPEVAEAIAEIMGVKLEAQEPDIARPGCTYGVASADVKFLYDGMNDCRAAAMMSGGMKVCSIGCLGLGTCAQVCPFDAITMGSDGLPVVDSNRCTGCGTCERVSPKNIIRLSSVTRRILLEYTIAHCTTPCQRACPAGIDICEYIHQIQIGDYRRSVQVIKERNPFPTVIGRICPRPCEDECRRKLVDEPVAINFLKRFVADYEREQGDRVQPYKAPETDKRVAVVGGGVEGLSTAFFTARLGHSPTVFEASGNLGGLLRSAIAQYRLPPEILDWDIDGILEMGVTAETGKQLGRDMTIHSLLSEGFQTVFLAAGGWDSRLARGAYGAVESPFPGAYLAIDMMRYGEKIPDRFRFSGNTAVLGEGKGVVDIARRCRALGAESVTILSVNGPSSTGMDAAAREELEADKIRFVFQTGVGRIYGEAEQLQGVEYTDGETGHRETLAIGNFVFASGRFPELIFKRPDPEDSAGEDAEPIETQRWESVLPYKRPDQKDETGLFSPGDVRSDYSGAIRAIAAGRRGAVSIHEVMYGISVALPENVVSPGALIQNVDHVENVAARVRQIMPICSGEALAQCGEIEKGYSEEAAIAEANRCLQCGLICYQKTESPQAPEGAAAVSASA
jgi:formate dehydrogenase beta subunit